MPQRLSKSVGARVTVHKDSKYLGSKFDSFDSIEDVKNWVRREYKGRGRLAIMVSQDGGYHNSFGVVA